MSVYIDNFAVSSSHGPPGVAKPPYEPIYPSFMILSNYYTGFTGDLLA